VVTPGLWLQELDYTQERWFKPKSVDGLNAINASLELNNTLTRKPNDEWG